MRLHSRHLNPRLLRLYEFVGLTGRMARASGSHVWTEDGERYVDMFAAFGCLALGHNPPKILEYLREWSARPNLTEGVNPAACSLAHNIAELTGGLERVFYANGGTEAVDAALMLVRAATRRRKILACKAAFHGRSIGALSVMNTATVRENFEPLLPGCDFVHFGSADQAEAALATREYAGFIMEPVQGEAGFVVPPPGFLAEIRRLCTKYGTLLIFDEIQTGLGRTGKMFAYELWGAKPDCLLLGKALGAGVIPVSCVAVTDRAWKDGGCETPQSPFHHSTYGGSVAACAAGLACIETLVDEDLPARAASLGNALMERLRQLQNKHKTLAAVRGVGLMIGIELAKGDLMEQIRAANPFRNLADIRHLLPGLVLRRLIKHHHFVTTPMLFNPDMLRIQPPLNMGEEDIDAFVEALDETLQHMESISVAALQAIPDMIRFVMPRGLLDAFE